MDEVMKKLSDIEIAAEAIVAHAEAQKAIMDEEYRKKTEKFDSDLEADTSKKIRIIKDELELKKAKLLDELVGSSGSNLETLKRDFDTKHSEIAAAITKRILTVE